MVHFAADTDKVQGEIDLYTTTVDAASNVQKAILYNYKSLISKVDEITQTNNESTTNREKTGFVYSQRSTYVLIDAFLTTLVFALAIVYGLRMVWPNPYLLSSWAFFFLILLAPYIIHKIFSVTTSFLPVNVYALWATT